MLRIYLLFLFTLIFWSNYSQEKETPSYLNLNRQKGLPSNECYHVIEDSKNYIWIASDNGVVKYNGRSFKYFNVSNGLTDNVVYKLYLDEQDNVWCSTSNSKICYIDPFDKVHEYQFNDSIQKYISKKGGSKLTIVSMAIQNDILSLGYFNKNGISINAAGIVTSLQDKNSLISIYKIGDKVIHYSSSGPGYAGVNFNGLEKLNISPNVSKGHVKVFASAVSKYGTIFSFHNQLFLKDNLGKLHETTLDKSIIFIKEINGIIWCGLSYGGAIMVSFDGETLKAGQDFYRKFSISSINGSEQSGYWFTSLENGVYYLPDLDYQQVQVANENQSILDFQVEKNKIYLSVYPGLSKVFNSNIESVYQFKDTLSQPNFKRLQIDSSSSAIFGLLKNDTMINSDGVTLSKFKYSKYRMLSTKNGIHVYATSNTEVGWVKNTDTLKFFCDKTIESSKIVKTNIILTHARGATHLTLINDSIYYSGTFLPDNQLTSLKVYDDKFYVSTKTGLIYEYLPYSNQTKLIYSEQGASINDFHIDYNTVFIAQNTGLIKYDTKTNIKELYWAEPVNYVHSLGHEVVFCDDRKIIKSNIFKIPSDISISHESIILNGRKIEKVGKELTFDQNNLEFNFEVIGGLPQKQYSLFYHLIKEDTLTYELEGGSVKFSELSPGDYEFYVSCPEADIKTKPIHFRIKSPFWQTWWFFTIVTLTVGIIIASILRYFYKRKEERITFEKQIVELQSSALRAQMNPHFVFNVMNVIQSELSSSNVDNASKVLVKFSRLMRESLNFSSEDEINLEDEIRFVQNYFHLESLRTDYKLELIINFDEKLAEVKIPPLIIQPLVENAIIHGILTSGSSAGTVVVTIEKIKDCLCIKVQNTGTAVQEDFTIPESSKGLTIIKKRLSLLKPPGNLNYRRINNDNFVTEFDIKIPLENA